MSAFVSISDGAQNIGSKGRGGPTRGTRWVSSLSCDIFEIISSAAVPVLSSVPSSAVVNLPMDR